MKDHPTKRLEERTSIGSKAIPKLRKLIAKKRSDIPEGKAHHINLGGKGYAVVKRVRNKPVLATVLAPDMKPPGVSLNSLLGVDKLRAIIKTAYSTVDQLNKRESGPPPPTQEAKMRPVKPKRNSQAVDPTLSAARRPELLVREPSNYKLSSAQLAAAVRRSGTAADRAQETAATNVDQYSGSLPRPMEILRAATGDPTQSYEAFYRGADPRLVALIKALESAVSK